MNATGKRGRGRPTKFNDKNKEKAEKLSRRGFTDKEIAEIIEVNERSVNEWKIKHPDFSQSLKNWKIEADGKVEASLYERACGYSHVETKTQWVQDLDGGRWETIEITKHYAPDTTACIFWLKNRQPGAWRDRQELKHEFDEPLIDIVRKLRSENKGEEK